MHDRERGRRAEPLRRRPRRRLSGWLGRVVATPGLTALPPADGAARPARGLAARGRQLVARSRARSSTSARAAARPGIPLAASLPEREVVAARGRAAASATSSSAGRLPNARVVWGRAEEQETDWAGVAVAKALAPPPVAAEWCLPLVGPGGVARALGRRDAPSPTPVARGRRAARRRARREPAPACSSCASRPDAAGLPAPAGRREEASARVTRHHPGLPGNPACRAGSTRSRTRRAASARRRPPSTSRRASPRRASGRSSSTSTRRRTRPRGSGCARTARRATTCSTARRSRELAKPTAFPNLFLVPSKPELAGAAVELSRRDDGERYLAESLADAERLRLRPARLPAVARPADRERARGRRPRDRAGAGRVLRARGARAADAVDQPDQGAAEPAARDRAAC